MRREHLSNPQGLRYRATGSDCDGGLEQSCVKSPRLVYVSGPLNVMNNSLRPDAEAMVKVKKLESQNERGRGVRKASGPGLASGDLLGEEMQTGIARG